MKVMSLWTLFEVWFTSTVFYKEIILHEKEIVQYLQNCKNQDFNQGHF